MPRASLLRALVITAVLVLVAVAYSALATTVGGLGPHTNKCWHECHV